MLITVGQHVFDGTVIMISEIELLNKHRSHFRDAMDKIFLILTNDIYFDF